MPVSTVTLTTNYEAGPHWWDSGGMDLWLKTAESAGEPNVEDEMEIPATEAAKFLCKAALIPGWEQEPVVVNLEE